MLLHNADMPPPRWRPERSVGLRLNLWTVLPIASLVALSLVLFVFKPPAIVALLVAVALPGALFLLARETQKRLDAFEREFGVLVLKNDVNGLMSLWNRSGWVRLLGPQHHVLSRWAMILSLNGRLEAADSVLEEAYMLAPLLKRAPMLGPLARSKYAIGDYASAAIISEQWRARAQMTGTPSLYLAASMVELPTRRLPRIRELLEEAEGRLTESDRTLSTHVRARLVDLEREATAAPPGAESRAGD